MSAGARVVANEEKLIESLRRQGPGSLRTHPVDDPTGPKVQLRKWSIEKAMECTKEPAEVMRLAKSIASFVEGCYMVEITGDDQAED